tara:strand:- start:232 stop:1275 length:1044 start_codon:yes stop_codon:yes gene_type:complete
MTEIPLPIHTVANLVDGHHADQLDEPRLHLGGSMLGHPCDRWLWLSFRWAVREKFPGRIRRLFRRGRNEEEIVVDDLKAIGLEIGETGDGQRFLNLGKHVGGSVDGIIESGVPGAIKTRHILEIKTHNKKSFDDLEKKGVKDSKPMHWAQMQIYMRGTKINRALYVAVCKDDDRLFTERVKYDEEAAGNLLDRGHRIALTERLPDPLSTDASWYQCKFCSAHSFCHKEKLTQEVNCRTCAHATPENDGTWSCARWDSENIPGDFQKIGCDSHVLHPDLVPWPIKDSNTPDEAIYVIAGKDIRNGEGDAYVFSSKELIAGGEACADDGVQQMRETFPGAEVVEVRDAP